MIKFKKINKNKAPEHLHPFRKIDILDIEGFRKIDRMCTVLAITEDMKHILNTDSCDYYQSEKFDKTDILEMIEDLEELAGRMK